MATIFDVAKEAGVSIATVSRVLNGSSNVSQKSEEAVREAVKKLRYASNNLAVRDSTGAGQGAVLGGVKVLSGGSLAIADGMSDTVILEKSAAAAMTGGAVSMLYTGEGRVSLTGTSQIQTVMLQGGSVLQIAGELAPAMPIGVRVTEPGTEPVVLTEGLKGRGSKEIFVSEENGYEIGVNAAGEAVLSRPLSIAFEAGNEQIGGSMEGAHAVYGTFMPCRRAASARKARILRSRAGK